MMRFITLFLLLLMIVGSFSVWWLYRQVYVSTPAFESEVMFEINRGDSVRAIATRLATEGLVDRPELLVRYIAWKELDRSITHGVLRFDRAMTIVELADFLTQSTTREERVVTIIPGSNLREIALYFEREGIAEVVDVYALLGKPAERAISTYPTDRHPFLFQGKPDTISLEGYLAPETFRVYVNATLEEIVELFISLRARQIEEVREDIERSGRTVFDILTLASILEKEVRGETDKKMVADLFWRRLGLRWALQADSTVHYAVGKLGNVFTTATDRETRSLWNTYQYPGLPAGPISMPSMMAIRATLHPTPNDYWYFLTTLDTGDVKYGRTLEEHNMNVWRYLR